MCHHHHPDTISNYKLLSKFTSLIFFPFKLDQIFLNQKEGILKSISYDLKGCLFSHACVNTIIKLAQNKLIKDAKKITKQDIIAYLKTLPKAEEHCASHAISVFNMALDNLDE